MLLIAHDPSTTNGEVDRVRLISELALQLSTWPNHQVAVIGMGKQMRILSCTLSLCVPLLSAGASALAQMPAPDEVVAVIPLEWVVFADGQRGKRLYRKYTITQDAKNVPNVVSFVCPRDKATMAHLTFHLQSMVKMEAISPSGFDKVEGRFLVDQSNSFSLPGEIIKSDMFFDRAPATWKEIDRLMFASSIQIRFGPYPAKVAFRVKPEFDEVIRKIATDKLKGVRYFATSAVLADCMKWRGER
ncbi:hypothetical protein OIU35_30295 [Boseaceae bacterium BT-24-1]|nr:hypothetical protein [Boseaceae bacterium BT-24-1]